MTEHDLLNLAKAYGAHQGLTLSTVSTYAAGAGHVFGRLEGGGGAAPKVRARIALWFSDNWPADLEWPAKIERPERSAA